MSLSLVFLTLLALPAGARGLPEEAETCLGCHNPDGGAPTPRLESYAATAHRSLACTACHPGADEAPHGKLPAPDCTRCHAEATKSYRTTVHGEAAIHGSTRAASCVDCHGAHDVRPGIDSRSRVGKPNLAATCGSCHRAEAAAYRASVHGAALAAGTKEAPACTDCHGEHTVRSPSSPESSVSSGSVTRTCASCHASERLVGSFKVPAGRVESFMSSYHGLAAQNGSGLRVASCASCHGVHDIRPSSDPASRIHPANVATACGQCHAGAALRLGTGKVHESLSGSGEGSRAAGLLRIFYLIAIPLTIGGMLFHNLLDLAHKALTGDRRPMRAEEDPMLSGGERLQHAALAVTFLLLAYSGFALKYTGHWWGLPFESLGGEALRRLVHRAAAGAFCLVGVYHAAYLLLSAAGKARLSALLPSRRDLRDPFRVLAYNAGLTRRRPALARFSYIEKAEYWALVWGSGVMLATGAVLAFDSLTLRLLPLWVMETASVVHFMEAVLACLAILVWHGYWVAFDPEIYPMNWAWLTGRPRIHKEEK
ncbi:MAG: hypothetical protein HYZ75_03775 [Elusimicrobia bacterium]|nr:hypothetical protein [Elusimicrobiota bacterium]